MTEMERVQKAKGNPALRIQNVDYGKVIAIESYDSSIVGYLKNIIRCLCFDFEIEMPLFVSDKVFFYSMSFVHRKDYDEIKDYFISIFPEFCVVNIRRKKSLNGTMKKVIKTVIRTAKYFKLGLQSPLLIAVLVTEYQALHELYLRMLPWDKFKVIGTFCDASCADNLTAQVGKMNGAKTFTLQHGQYRILRQGFENADAESYKNFISDILLAWGDATRDEFVKYGIDENRVIPVGALKKFSFNHRLMEKVDTKIFGVILSGDTYKESNIKMIKIANEIARRINMRYLIRFHPRNKKGIYVKYINTDFLFSHSHNLSNYAYARKVEFSIIHMTGTFVEMLSLNSPIFIFDDEYLEDVFKLEDFCFVDSDQFISLYGSAKERWNNLKERQYKWYQYFNKEGDVVKNYRKTMERLI